jgi:hypothetical protein
LIVAALLPLLALFALFAAARTGTARLGRGALLLAEPKGAGAPGVGISAIEDLRYDSGLLVAYEVRKPGTVQALNRSCAVTLIGTNSVYADVLGRPVTDGGFFTKAAYDAGSRVAVLNGEAAFEIFGGGHVAGTTFRIGGELWTVVGVISDGDAEGANVYVPASAELIAGGGSDGSEIGGDGADAAPLALMALMNGNDGGSAGAAAAALKDIGVADTGYDLKRLGKAIAALSEMWGVAWRFALCLLLGAFAWLAARAVYTEGALAFAPPSHADNARSGGADSMGGSVGEWANVGNVGPVLDVRAAATRGVRPSCLPRPAYTPRRPNFAFAVLGLLALAACAAVILPTARQIAEVCVTWREIPVIFGTASPSGAFGTMLTLLGGYQATVTCLFAASITASAIFFPLLLTQAVRVNGQRYKHTSTQI